MNSHIRRSVLAAALAVALGGCADSAPPGSPDPGVPAAPEPVSVAAERDGVVVTLTVSTAAAVAGESIKVRVDILNRGFDPVTWKSGGCEMRNGFGIQGPPIAQPPDGRAWPDAAGLAKWSATTSGVSLDYFRDPRIPEGAAVGCPADLRYDQIDPGTTASAETVWSGRTTEGVPAPAGSYQFTYGFPFIDRGPANHVQGDAPEPRPIDVAVKVELNGNAFTGIPSTLAIDTAFADPRVAAWVNGHLTKERLGGGEIRLVDGRWRFTIMLDDGRSTTVFVDPATGRVVEVNLAE